MLIVKWNLSQTGSKEKKGSYLYWIDVSEMLVGIK